LKDRIAYLFVATAAILSLAHISLARDGKAEFSIVISAPQSVKAGANVVVDIAATNVSDHAIVFGSWNDPHYGERDFGVDVFNSQGELAPRTQYGKAVREEDQGPGSTIVFTGNSTTRYLALGETRKESSRISELFDLKPGVYRVKVWRADYHETSPPTIASAPEDSDLRKPAGTHPSPATNPPPAKPKAIARSNTITITITP
jgi:hypothetical protein